MPNFFLGAKKGKIFIGFLLFFIFLFLFLPVSPTTAQEWMPRNIANSIVSLVFQFTIWLTNIFFGIAVWFLSWVTSPGFISVKITDNDFVNPQWGLVRDLTNMVFIVALIAIGLGTALRVTGYQAQKALPRLIIAALLVNFTLVICGFFIDAANITMNFFLGDAANLDQWRDLMQQESERLVDLLKGNEANLLDFMGRGLSITLFNMIGGFALFAFGIIFAVRYVALWILVVLSPLAVASQALPALKGMIWNKWINNFTQWLLVGVTGAFWLYLAQQLIMLRLSSSPPPSEQFGGIATVFNYTIPIFFLWSGLAATLATGVAGATAAIHIVDKQVVSRAKTAGAWAARKAGGGIKKGVLEHTPQGVRTFARRLETAPDLKAHWGAGEKGIGGWAKRTAAGVANVTTTIVPIRPLMGAVRATGRTVAGTVIDARREEINKGTSEGDKIQDVDRLVSEARSASGDRKAGLVKSAIKKGGAFKSAIDKILSNEEIIELITKAVEAGDIPTAESLRKGFVTKLATDRSGRFRSDAGLTEIDRRTGLKLSKEDEEKGYKSFTHKLIAEAKESDIKEFSKGFFNSPDAMAIIQKFWSGNQVGAAAREFGNSFVDSFMENAEKRETIPGKGNAVDWFIKNNRNLALHLTGNAAQDLGLNLPGGRMRREDLQTRIQELRAGPPSLSPVQKTLAAANFERAFNTRVANRGDSINMAFGGRAPAGDLRQLFKDIIDNPERVTTIQDDNQRKELANLAQRVLLQRAIVLKMAKQRNFSGEIYKEIASNLPMHRDKRIEDITKTDIRALTPLQRTQGLSELIERLPLNQHELDIQHDLGYLKSADDSETKQLVKAIYDEMAKSIQPFRGRRGVRALNTCPRCGQRVPPPLAVCPHCGQSLTTTPPPTRPCRRCGAINPATARTCAYCNQPL